MIVNLDKFQAMVSQKGNKKTANNELNIENITVNSTKSANF